ncbi:MAG: hypothetical protein AAFX06_07120 [Planctomycetota bacterium]
MSAEAGYEVDEDSTPLRVSGFLALITALIGGFGVVAPPMGFFAVAAIGFGVFALRKSDSVNAPVGTTPARIGLVLAVLFGSCAIARPLIKQYTLARQAEYFARQFVSVASSGNEAYTAELHKSYVNRFLKSMPLERQYQEQREQFNKMRTREDGAGTSAEPPELSSISLVSAYPPDHEWVLDRPVHVYHHYGRRMAQVVLAADDSKNPYRIMIILEFLVHKDRGTLEWHVDTFQTYRDRLVAESIL